jgi:hypothetical protein
MPTERTCHPSPWAVTFTLSGFLAACAAPAPPEPAQQQPAAAKASADSRAGLPIRVEPVEISCAGKGYTAKYFAETCSVPPTVDVTFRGVQPTSASAEQALRRCLEAVAQSQFLATEVMGTAWYSKSGVESDDEIVALKDGSNHLLYRPENKEIVSWNARDGQEPQIAVNAAGGYFVKTEVNKILVAPGGTFIHLSTVFAKEPSEKLAYETAIAEVKQSVASQANPVATSAFIKVGAAANPAAWRQVRGADGEFIMAEFSPKRGKQIVSGSGRPIGSIGDRP